jgi:hypothetical protein
MPVSAASTIFFISINLFAAFEIDTSDVTQV